MRGLSVCFVAPNLYPILSGYNRVSFAGGAEAQQAQIAKELARRGYAVSAAVKSFGDSLPEQVEGVRLLAIDANGHSVSSLRFPGREIVGIWNAMRRANAQVYYLRIAGRNTALVAAFCWLYRRKFIFNGAHDSDFIPGRHLIPKPRDRLLYRYGLRRAGAIVVQNQAQQELLAQHFARRGTVIANCYEVPTPVPSNLPVPTAGYVLWVATLRKWKRPEYLLRLARDLPLIRFVMIGGPSNGPNEADIYRAIQREAIQIPNLHFCGFISPRETEAYFNSAALFINTSVSEGFPNTFLQAWARSVPTVSFVHPQVGDSVQFPGLVVKDYGQLLSQAHRLTMNSLEAKGIGHACEVHFKEYHSVSVAVDKYENVIQKLAGITKQLRPTRNPKDH